MAAKKATFEDNMKRLEEIVEALESGNVKVNIKQYAPRFEVRISVCR